MATHKLTVQAVLSQMQRAQALGKGAKTALEAVWRAAGVYGSAPTCHLSVCVRTQGYCPEDLDRAAFETRELLRVPAMRGSIYLMPKELVPAALALTKLESLAQFAHRTGNPEKGYAPLSERIEQLVWEKPQSSNEIRTALGEKAPEGTALRSVIARMTREGRLVRAKVRGGPRSQNYEYAAMRRWAELPKERPSQTEALRILGALWLKSHGPGTAADLAWWAGTSQREAKAALDQMKLRTVHIEGLLGEHYASDQMLQELAELKPEPSPVHLIPCWDAYEMSHKDRSRYMQEEMRPYLSDKMGNLTNVILKAGKVAGIWDLDGDKLLYSAFEPLSEAELSEASKELEPLHSIKGLQEVKKRVPLTERPQNAFMSPLRG